MDAAATAAVRCSRCGRPAGADDYVCSLCGEVLRRSADGAQRPSPAAASAPWPATGVRREDELRAGQPGWEYLLVGMLLAPVLTFTPLLQYVGWFLSALFHETGHAAVGWALGCPTVPAVSIAGEAAAVHGDQKLFLCAFWMACLGGLAWASRAERPRLVLFGAAFLAYPVLAFTGAREALFLAGGHLGELAFGTVFLVQAIAGGFTDSPAERAAHSMLGWYFVAKSAWLCGGLLWSDQARATYASNGSFGLENDYARLARDILHVPLSAVAGGMLLLAVATVPLAVVLGRRIAAAND